MTVGPLRNLRMISVIQFNDFRLQFGFGGTFQYIGTSGDKRVYALFEISEEIRTICD